MSPLHCCMMRIWHLVCKMAPFLSRVSIFGDPHRKGSSIKWRLKEALDVAVVVVSVVCVVC